MPKAVVKMPMAMVNGRAFIFFTAKAERLSLIHI